MDASANARLDWGLVGNGNDFGFLACDCDLLCYALYLLTALQFGVVDFRLWEERGDFHSRYILVNHASHWV